jgi:phosphoglycerate kinase
MPTFRTVDDIHVRGKRVLLRADLNVPTKNGIVTDTIDRLAGAKTEVENAAVGIVDEDDS